MSPQSQTAGSAALYPPLPDMGSSGTGDAGAGAPGGGFMAALMGSVGPVKQSVDQINSACQQIVQSGKVPGAEQLCSQIISMANQLTMMALQQAAQPGQGGPVGPPQGGPGAGAGAGAPPIPPAVGAPPVAMGQGQ